jgi:hypothetical protein
VLGDAHGQAHEERQEVPQQGAVDHVLEAVPAEEREGQPGPDAGERVVAEPRRRSWALQSMTASSTPPTMNAPTVVSGELP